MLAANGLMALAALARNRELAELPAELTELAARLEPVVLGTLVLLCAGRPWLARMAAPAAALAVVGVAMAVGGAAAALLAPLFADAGTAVWRSVFWSGLGMAGVLAWFDLNARARSPAVAEARLLALTARIRPHFLFNSLNAVLGLIRVDPRRAETALEELADLFRALMRDNRDLAPLSDEIALARQYLALERLRLGERLQVRWDVESCPPDALVPPLMLQPLLENAVYHGIEPLADAGEIVIRLARQQSRLVIEIVNPVAATEHEGGNRMALANIRERLMLFFDVEAELHTEVRDGRYRVSIRFPYRPDGGES